MERAGRPPACGLYSLAEWYDALMDAKRETGEASDDEDLLGMFRDTDDDEDAPATLGADASASESDDDDDLSLVSDHGDESVQARRRGRRPPAADDNRAEPPRKRLRRGDPAALRPGGARPRRARELSALCGLSR